jgi:hypothetical protein
MSGLTARSNLSPCEYGKLTLANLPIFGGKRRETHNLRDILWNFLFLFCGHLSPSVFDSRKVGGNSKMQPLTSDWDY